MKNFVDKTIEKLNREASRQSYDIERLKKSCLETSIPKEFLAENIDNIEDKLEAFTLGCELFNSMTNYLYSGNSLEQIEKIKEVGVYQFLQATLQDKVGSIVSDRVYLQRLLELNNQDIEEFSKSYSNYNFNIEIDTYSTVGLVRDVNQDNLRVYQKDELLILIVADGVGGGEDGDIASELASNTSIDYLEQQNYNVSNEDIENYLTQAIMESNDAVLDYAEKNGIKSIGTTLSIALVYNRKLFIGHVGDSRIYRISNRDIKTITQDHSLPEVLYRKGDITEEERADYKKNILVYVIGKKGLRAEELNVFTAKDLTYDTLFLCSDGVWDIDDGKIKNRFDGNVKQLKESIIDSVPADNATFIRCTFKSKGNNSFFIDENGDNNDDIHLELIDLPEKPESVNRFLPIIFATLVLGIAYFVYNILSSPAPVTAINDLNQTTKEEANRTIIDRNITLSNRVNENETKKIAQQSVVAISTPTIKKEIPKERVTSSSASVVIPVVKKDKAVVKESRANNSTITTEAKPIKIEVPKSRVILDTTQYKQSDMLTIDKMKIWFSKDKIMSTQSCFGTLVHTDKRVIRCKIKKHITNPEIVKGLTKPKFAKSIKIGWHKELGESHIVISLNSDYKFVEVKRVNAPDHVEDVVFKKIVKLSKPRVKHWSDGDALYLDDSLITFKKDAITLTDKNASCIEDGNRWICKILDKRVNYKDITSKLKKQEFAKSVELSSYNSKESARVVVTLKDEYSLLSNITVNGNRVLRFHKKY